MVSTALLSTLATLLLLLVIVVRLSQTGSPREVERPGAVRAPAGVLSGATGWMLGFLAVAVLVGVSAVAAVSDGALLPGVGGDVLPVALGMLGGVIVGFVLLGTYTFARTRGAAPSLAAALSVSTVGFIVLAGVVLNLDFSLSSLGDTAFVVVLSTSLIAVIGIVMAVLRSAGYV